MELTSGINSGDLIYYYPQAVENEAAPYTVIALAYVIRRLTEVENATILATITDPVPANTGPYLAVSFGLANFSLNNTYPGLPGSPVLSAGAVVGVIKAAVDKDAIAALYPAEGS
jgi:hypothetical protein